MKSKPITLQNKAVYDDLQLLLDNTQDYAIIRLDSEGYIMSWNKGAERIKGYTQEEIIGKNFEIFYPKEEIKKGRPQENLKLATTNGTYAALGTRIRKDGTSFWGDMVITALYTDDKKLRGFVKITRDMSGRKELSDELELLHHQAEEIITKKLNLALKENADYKYALDESAIVATTDQKGIITHVNDNFCKISQYSRNELIGQDHRIINSGFHPKEYIQSLWTTIANGIVWKGELKNRAKNGSFYWVDTTIVPFLNEKGKPYQYLAIRSDITARKLNEEKIIESEQFIKTITENLPAMITYWDANLRCKFANQSCLEWFDKTELEILGIHKMELFGQEEFAQHEIHIKKVLEGTAQRFEHVFHKPNNKKIFADTQYLPDRLDGITKGFYSLIYDITEVKQAELAEKHALEERNNILESIDDAFFAVDKY